jgi:hypothetical protein
MKKLWPYLRTFIIISLGIVVIAVGMHWGIRTWGMRNIHTDIDWVDFIKFNNITYLASGPPVPISSENLTYYDKVRFKLSENVNDPNYRSKNGDAAFLEVGTPVYAINGYSPMFRLWAGGITFEADTNPKARKGADLLDLDGKVEYITIGSDTAVTLQDPGQVGALVDMILNAPVKQNVPAGGTPVFIYFHLKDGTTISRAFWPEQGQLHRGIMLPKDFWEILESRSGENP